MKNTNTNAKDLLSELTDDLYTAIVLDTAKRVTSEESIKTDITFALYAAFNYGRNLGWSIDWDESVMSMTDEELEKYVNSCTRR